MRIKRTKKGQDMTYFLEHSVRYMRDRAEAARAELTTCTDPDLRRYLAARINQAEAEAGAMQRSIDRWKALDLEAEVTLAECLWSMG